MPISESNVCKIWSFSTVLIFSEVFRVDALQNSKILVYLYTLVEVMGHLFAFWDLVGTQKSIVIEALHVGSFVWQAGELLVGLIAIIYTLY